MDPEYLMQLSREKDDAYMTLNLRADLFASKLQQYSVTSLTTNAQQQLAQLRQELHDELDIVLDCGDKFSAVGRKIKKAAGL